MWGYSEDRPTNNNTTNNMNDIDARKINGTCWVCGRSFKRENAGKRGRAKQQHPECRELMKSLNRVASLLGPGAKVDGEVVAVRFAGAKQARQMKGLLFSLVNTATNNSVFS